jgi:hypothetical protein
MTYTSDISKYFDTTTFNVNLRGNDSVMFSLSKIIPPNFHDFTNLDWTQCVPLPLNKDDWTSNDWLDLQFDFEANFRYFIPGWTDGFDNYFQQIHWDHIQIDNIDSSARNLTLKGDGINYYTDDLLTFTGVEFK